jgi:D-alanyl-D-alanine endopeptidase (penicillin-binding protein 7)
MNALDSTWTEAIGWALLHFLWQGALLGGACALAMTLMRKARPQARYAVACATLALCVLLPVLSVYYWLGESSPVVDVGDTLAWMQIVQPWLPVLVVLWCAGVLVMACRLTAGILWAGRLRRAGRADPQWQHHVRRLARGMGRCRPIAVRVVEGLSGPITAGWRQPVILIPASLLTRMPAELLEALIAHEVAHVVRWDYLVNLLQSVAEALLFFHPAVWWLSCRIRIEREQIADDLAAGALGEPRRLALALHALSQTQQPPPLPALGAHGGQLLHRIRQLLRPSHHHANWRATLPLLAIAMGSLLVHAHSRATALPAVPKAQAQAPVHIIATPPAPSVPSGLGRLLHSGHVLVRDDDSGRILLAKDADTAVPIASLTKLVTAMVVLDAKPDMSERIRIASTDVDTLKFSRSHVPVGAVLARDAVLSLALMSSDNRAANALARTYPGGIQAFDKAVSAKLSALGLAHTTIAEPTGLSPRNTSTASDMALIVSAAASYPDIVHATTHASRTMQINGKAVAYHNTNPLVGRTGWHIQLSKTGFTNEAGRCMVLRINDSGRRLTLVLLDAGAQRAAHAMDAANIQRYLGKTAHRTS